jgi:hypothetical protein
MNRRSTRFNKIAVRSTAPRASLFRRSPGAFTLIEAVVTCLVALTILGVILAFFYHGQVWSVRSTDQAVTLGELRTALVRVAKELREGKQVLYPAVGRRSQEGLGLLNARGETIVYSLAASSQVRASAPFDLVREKVSGPKEIILRNVTRFLVTTADPGKGRDPVLVRLLLTRVLGDQGPGEMWE